MAAKVDNLKRNTRVKVLVTDTLPYEIMSKDDVLLGSTLIDDMGVYLHNVNFKVIDGQPVLEGKYMGKIEELRLNLSRGTGIMFDKDKQAFTDGKKIIKAARMVQVYNGIIKVVIGN
ncbi:hypothetical protein [Pseudobacillus badius]|uniref:hypothetical protein n=1 Tax=Bacillus badius TaxID=1455 RepID=UPI0007B3A79C|nr:hypothetical protein [Bacillus badius]KZR57521.1 hypothetical protein A3781_19710 [Bacillus badius]